MIFYNPDKLMSESTSFFKISGKIKDAFNLRALSVFSKTVDYSYIL